MKIIFLEIIRAIHTVQLPDHFKIYFKGANTVANFGGKMAEGRLLFSNLHLHVQSLLAIVLF